MRSSRRGQEWLEAPSPTLAPEAPSPTLAPEAPNPTTAPELERYLNAGASFAPCAPQQPNQRPS